MSVWVFLRGLTRESRHWGAFVDTFEAEVTGAAVVAIDLPGNGSMNYLPSPTRVEDLAEWCRRELSARGIRGPYYLLGMSLGAMVATEWAHSFSNEVRGCVLINGSLRPFSPFYQRLRPANYLEIFKLALLGGSAGESESMILRMTTRRRDTVLLLPAWIAWRRERPVTRLNALRQLLAASRYRAPANAPAAPTLVLASTADALVDVKCSREIASRWMTHYAEHPEAGHDLTLDDGAWVARQVCIWLTQSASLRSADKRTSTARRA
ncbi:MAG: alpha/beta hydrolase [Rhodocyclaceae bacterium]|nr:MAG: alpha/beta hydrolase [Rhodocyclaceae bacterium]